MESLQEGRNHGVTIRRWKPQSHHGKVETMESLQEVGNHSVTMGKVEMTESSWEG